MGQVKLTKQHHSHETPTYEEQAAEARSQEEEIAARAAAKAELDEDVDDTLESIDDVLAAMTGEIGSLAIEAA